MAKKYDFGGYATKFNVKCSDGRTIQRGAFKDNDGEEVPLVWQHLHDEPGNVIGHAVLEERGDGVYAYCVLNDTQKGKDAKELIKNRDVKSLSIYANKLREIGKNVVHGMIREVSLVLAGANPGAKIDQFDIVHSDDMSGVLIHSLSDEEDEEEDAIISCRDAVVDDLEHSDDDIPTIPSVLPAEAARFIPQAYLVHSDDIPTIPSVLPAEVAQFIPQDALIHSDALAHGEDTRTVGDILDTFTPDQRKVFEYLIATTYKLREGEDAYMKHNAFEGSRPAASQFISPEEMKQIFNFAQSGTGSLKAAVETAISNGYLQHAVTDDDGQPVTYGIANIDYLFPDARNVRDTPDFIKRDTEWVSAVMNGTKHTPFSRVRSIHADITMDEARAKGYITGKTKINEVFTLLRRTTDPQTIYKKQKLDRDHIIDITSFDVVAWIKSEMRVMLDEEIARAILIGDGRLTSAEDHIAHDHIRPIWTDDDLYTIKANITEGATDADTVKEIIKTALRTRKQYKGSGNPTYFTTEDDLCEMLLLEDGIGHRLYKTEAELASAMRVSRIVTVPVMENQVTSDGKKLRGIIVNLKDYNVGADKGGAVNMFDDFDINVNQYAYLIETRCSGALVVPHSAIAIQTQTASAGSGD